MPSKAPSFLKAGGEQAAAFVCRASTGTARHGNKTNHERAVEASVQHEKSSSSGTFEWHLRLVNTSTSISGKRGFQVPREEQDGSVSVFSVIAVDDEAAA